MSKIVKSILKALGLAMLGLILVNLIFFLVAYASADTTESWSASLRHGSFRLNDMITGFKFGSFPANTLMSIIIGLVLGLEYRNGNLDVN